MTQARPFPFPDIESLALSGSRAFELGLRLNGAGAVEILAHVIGHGHPGRVALVSSFGAESAVLLHMVAAIDPTVPVLTLDTGALFAETRRYRDRLIARLKLTDVRVLRPDPARLRAADPDGFLFRRDPDRCCAIRKVAPLSAALRGFDAWITGRKAFQGGARTGLTPFESDGPRIKINPLCHWSKADLEHYLTRHDVPRHPLEAQGFASIGCLPCTDRVAPGEDPRAGRWRGLAKTECGIHASQGGAQ